MLWYPIWHEMVANMPCYGNQYAMLCYGDPYAGEPIFGKPIFGKPMFQKTIFGKPISGKPIFWKTHFGNKHYIRWRRGLRRFVFLKNDRFYENMQGLGRYASSQGRFFLNKQTFYRKARARPLRFLAGSFFFTQKDPPSQK